MSGIDAAILVQPDGGEPLWLTKRFTIGTREDCALRLADEYASGWHALCKPVVVDWVIEDLGSTNGTFLNGAQIYGPQVLSKGDRVMVGHTMITVVPA